MADSGSRRRFDREAALRQAMNVFWAQGYEGTTLLDLQKAMGGINAPSFYAAYGSKEALFREAVALYSREQGQGVVRAVTESPTARGAVEAMLQAAVALFCRRGKPRGCLIVLGAINCAAENKSVEELLRHMRAERHKLLQQRLERAVAEGDLPASVDHRAMTAFYLVVLDGLALQARDGSSKKTLLSAVRGAMSAWDGWISG